MKKYLAILLIILFSTTEIYAIEYRWQKSSNFKEEDRKLAQSLTNKLDQLYEKEDHSALLAKIFAPKEPLMLWATAEWLEVKSFSSGDARYAYYYAAALLVMKKIPNMSEENIKTFKETAATMFFLGKLMIIIDGERCKDKHIAYPTIFYELEEGIKGEISNYWKTLSDKEKDEI